MTLYREVVKILHRFMMNFQMRHLQACQEQPITFKFLETLFLFTIESLVTRYQTKRGIMKELSLYLNQIWQRISIELIQLKFAGLDRVDEMIQTIIVTQIEKCLEHEGEEYDQIEDENEEFQLSETVASREDQLLNFAKLIMCKISVGLPVLLQAMDKLIIQYE